MALYEPLGQYLQNSGFEEVPMTFQQVAKIIGRKLPASAYRHRPWWANEERGHSHAKAWLQAGYETERVDMAGKKLVFRRVKDTQEKNSSGSFVPGMSEPHRMFKAEESVVKNSGISPLFGALKGTFTIAPGYDLASPVYTHEEWAGIEKEMESDWDQIEEGLSGRKV